MASNSPKITIATLTNPSDPTSLACSSNSYAIPGASKIAALSLNQAGTTLYAADYDAQKIWGLFPPAFSTTAISIGTSASHDVADNQQSGALEAVYTASFQTNPPNDDGVENFSRTLSSLTNFLTLAQANAIGLTHPSGMLFDNLRRSVRDERRREHFRAGG